MEEERMRDAGWYMDKLEQRLFNRDAEGMLVERLGREEVCWAANSGMRPPEPVKGALECVDAWLDDEHILPSGPCVPPFPPDEAPEGFGYRELKHLARMTQVLQLFNSFGVGVFVGCLHLVIGEAACDQDADDEVSLGQVLQLLSSSPMSPDDLVDNGERPWARRLETNIQRVRRRTNLSEALRPLAERHHHLSILLPSRRFRCAKRGMFLAGLMAAGLEPKELLEEEAPQPVSLRERRPRREEAEEEVPKYPLDLYFLADKDLERCLKEASIREDVAEELEFRLRINHLRRMLAHLKRISRGRGGERRDDE